MFQLMETIKKFIINKHIFSFQPLFSRKEERNPVYGQSSRKPSFLKMERGGKTC